MKKRIGSFPTRCLEYGIAEIIHGLPDVTGSPNILELGSGSGIVGISVWKHYRDKDGREPQLLLVDIDENWFGDPTTQADCMANVCKRLDIKYKPTCIKYVVSDLVCYLRQAKGKFDVILMRSVLQFIDSPVDEVFHGIESRLSSNGTFVHGCFCFPNEDSRGFYQEFTGKYLAVARKSRYGRKRFTCDEIVDATRNNFEEVNVIASYALPYTNLYVHERLGIPPAQVEDIAKKNIPFLLDRFPRAQNALHIEFTQGQFRVDMPFFVITAKKIKNTSSKRNFYQYPKS